jgi:hypothetical protein
MVMQGIVKEKLNHGAPHYHTTKNHNHRIAPALNLSQSQVSETAKDIAIIDKLR